MDSPGKVAVTGAGHGLGRAYATAIAGEITAAGGRAVAAVVAVGTTAAAEALAEVLAAAVVAVPNPTWGRSGAPTSLLRSGADVDELAPRAHPEQRLTATTPAAP